MLIFFGTVITENVPIAYLGREEKEDSDLRKTRRKVYLDSQDRIFTKR